MEANIVYKSILYKLSQIPVEYLFQVDRYLANITLDIKEKNRQSILSFAGAWDDMYDEDFNAYLNFAKKTGKRFFWKGD